MNTLVNDKVISSFFNDDNFNTELKAMLNEMIDEELSKEPDDMDCDLIDECVQMLIEIEQSKDDGFAVLVPLINSKSIIAACEKRGFKYLSRGARASLIACIVLISAMTANAAVAKIFNYNIAQEVVNTISEKLKDWGIVASADDNGEIVIDEIPTSSKKTSEEKTAAKSDKADEKEIQEKTTDAQVKAEDVSNPYNSQSGTQETTAKPEAENSALKAPSQPDEALKTYTLTLDANGGKCDVDSVKVTYGRPIGELPVPTREGYDFDGWYNIDINYSRSYGHKIAFKLKSNTVYNLEKDAVVTAKWNKYCTIIFNTNGGKCAVDSLQVSRSSDVMKLPVPTKDGYVFIAWIDENGNIVTDTGNIWNRLSIDSTYKLEAVWAKEGEVYTVTLNTNGGSCDINSKQVIIGHPYGKLPTPTKSGYRFLGWIVPNDMIYEQITEDSIFLYHTELYALWYKTTATVTFDADGGECDVKSKTVYSHNMYGELPTPTKEGYIFQGWYYDECLIYTFSDVGEEPTDHTLKAKWNPVNVSVSFNANGGKISSNNEIGFTKVYKYMTEYGSLPEASREGYRFAGWYTECVGGTKIEETDIVDYLYDITLYAHWEKDEYICTVTLDSNDGDENICVLSYKKGDKLGEHKPAVNGGLFYEFAGWYTDKYYGEKIDSDFEITGDIELYAHWVFNTSLTSLSLELEKTEYELNEEIDINSVDLVLGIPNVNYKDYITGEMLAQEGAHIDYDTSTYGKHTLTVTLSVDLGYIVTLEASETIFVRGCTHNTGTHIGNQIEPTCIKEGYTGDTLCNGCNEVLKKGTAIKATGHNENTVTKIINRKEPTCSETGYTGDTICAVCSEVLQKGKSISKTAHITEEVITKATFDTSGKIAQVCTVCGQEESRISIPKATASLNRSSYTYDGSMKTPEVTISPKVDSSKMRYTITMDEGRTEIGKYNITITLSGEYYTGEKVLSFSIVPENTTLRLTATEDGFLADWDKVEGVSGYSIQYYEISSRDYTIVSVFNENTTSHTVENLKKGTYYVKIRTNKNGVSSSWSNAVKIIIG